MEATEVKPNEKVGLGNFKLPSEPKPPVDDKSNADNGGAPAAEETIVPEKVKGTPIDEEAKAAAEGKKGAKKEPVLKKQEVKKKKEEVVPDEIVFDEQEQKYLDSLEDNEEPAAPASEDKTPVKDAQGKKEKAKTPKYDDAKIQSAITKAEAYDKIIANPAIGIVEDFMKSGETDFFEYMNKKVPADPKKLSNEDMFKMSLADYELTPEEREEEIDRFQGKSKLEQQQIIKPIKDKLAQQREEGLRALSTKPAYKPEDLQPMVDAGLKTLDTQLNELGGTIKDGLRITDEVAALIREDVIENAVMREDGKGFDIAKSIKNAIRNNDSLDLIRQRDIRNVAKKQAYDLLIKQRNRPNRHDSPSGAMPPPPDDSKAVLAEIKKDRWKE